LLLNHQVNKTGPRVKVKEKFLLTQAALEQRLSDLYFRQIFVRLAHYLCSQQANCLSSIVIAIN